MTQQHSTSTQSPNRSKGGFPVGAVVLIGIGVLLLLQTTGVLSFDIWGELIRFWPVLIIIIGVNLIFGRRAPWLSALIVATLLIGSFALAIGLARVDSSEVFGTFSHDLGDLESANAKIEFGAGQLTVNSLPSSSAKLLEGSFEGRQAVIEYADTGRTTADVRLFMDENNLFRNPSNTEWIVGLTSIRPLALDIDSGAADMNLDLRELQLSRLELDTGAASVDIVMPKSGRVEANISGGAASIDIVIPEGVAARITSSSGLSSINIDSNRFPRSGDAHESPDFGTAANRVAIDLRVGVSSVSVR